MTSNKTGISIQQLIRISAWKITQDHYKIPIKPMAKVEIYTWQSCPFCIRAKQLLELKGIKYIEHSIDGDQVARESMTTRAGGRRTVPQIFIDNNGIGGCDELYQLEKNHQLDALLKIDN